MHRRQFDGLSVEMFVGTVLLVSTLRACECSLGSMKPPRA